MEKQYIVKAPLFPFYRHVAHCLRIWDGEPIQSARNMLNDIFEQTGTPQNPVDWLNPDEWIDERLTGESARLAKKIWEDSGRDVNPRHVNGCYLFINRLDLLNVEHGIYRLGERGTGFIDQDPQVVQEIDASEGIPKLLALVAETPQAKRSDLLDDWAAYLKAVSKFSTLSTFKDTLRRRLTNAVDRGLIHRDGNRYTITDAGTSYLKSFPELKHAQTNKKISSERTDVALAVRHHNEGQLKELKRHLMGLDPYAFEHFVKELLEAMDYENVEVTKQSGDKGIDVKANYQFGITEITEVVQVKRTESNIGRRTVDELRGALPYHGAIRGTIITIGSFVKGVDEAAFFPGAAPITLIDGERLLELIVKHEVGIRRKPIDLLEIDVAFFEERAPVTEEDT